MTITSGARSRADGEIAPSVFIRGTISSERRDSRGVVTHAGWLTPYVVETISDDARHAGSGARLEITVPSGAPLAAVDRVRRCFEHLAPRGIEIDVRHAQIQRHGEVA